MSHQAPQPEHPHQAQGQGQPPMSPGNPYGQDPTQQGYPQQGYAPRPYTGYGQPPQNRTNGLAVAALVVGIIAVLLSFIPLINIGAIVLGIVAVVLGILGLRKRFGGKGMSITGIVLGALSILISTIVLIATAAFVGYVEDEAKRIESQEFTVEYIATVDEGEGIVTYGVGGDTQTEQITDTWTHESTETGLKMVTLSVAAPTGTEASRYSCEIHVNGQTVSADSDATGATCSATTVE